MEMVCLRTYSRGKRCWPRPWTERRARQAAGVHSRLCSATETLSGPASVSHSPSNPEKYPPARPEPCFVEQSRPRPG